MLSEQGETSKSEVDSLHDVDWIPVLKRSYLLKYVFTDSKYDILVSNLTSVFEEEMIDTDVEARFNDYNPHIKMKPRTILQYLKRALTDDLSPRSRLDLKSENSKMIITLNFHACLASCKYTFEMNLMPEEKFMQHIIVPTVLGSLLSQNKILELQSSQKTTDETEPSVSSETYSSDKAFDPDWPKGIDVPFTYVCESFLSIQSHFKELFSENDKAFFSIKKNKRYRELKALGYFENKKAKLTESDLEEPYIKFDAEEFMIQEEKFGSNVFLELPKITTEKEEEKKSLEI